MIEKTSSLSSSDLKIKDKTMVKSTKKAPKPKQHHWTEEISQDDMSITKSQTDANLIMLLPNFAAVWLGAFKGTSNACASALSLAWRSASIAAFISLVRRSFEINEQPLVGSSCLDLAILKKSKILHGKDKELCSHRILGRNHPKY